jgi:hypothetical protein
MVSGWDSVSATEWATGLAWVTESATGLECELALAMERATVWALGSV